MDTPEELKDLVDEYEVCWEVWPIRYPKDGALIPIGYEIDLIGTLTRKGRKSLLPTDDCMEVYDALSQIAKWIVPENTGEAEHDIQIFDNTVRYSKKRKNRPDIQLKIQISHRTGYDQPVDVNEERMLQGIVEKLRALGAREGAWQQS